jgi:single-strand DNA-binding protein
VSYATTIICGHLGRDPEQRYLPDGSPVTRFSVAVSRTWTDKSGERQEDTTWYNVSVFGNQAEPCARYLAKGRMVLVEGDVKARAYLDRDTGEARASLDLRARTVRFLGGRSEKDSLSDISIADVEEIPF